MCADKLFLGGVSKIYVKARPTISTAAKEAVIEYLKEKLSPPYDLAVDIGCGTGHNTALFAPYFNRLLGIDTSETQIEQAKINYPFCNIKYSVGDAHELPTVESNSVSLVLSVQAVHWLDLPKFFAECDRILKPNGVLALIGYKTPTMKCPGHPECDNEIDQLIKQLFDKCCWSKKIHILEREYVDFELPYEDKKIIKNDPSIYLKKEVTIEESIELFRTWSGYQELKRQSPNTTALEDLETGLISTMPGSNKQTKVEMIFPWFVMMCRKPS